MYLLKTIRYGNRIEHWKYHTSRYGVKGEKRQQRQKATEECVARANERAAERRLYRLLVANFTEDDHFLTLTYKRELRPDVEGSKQILRKFFEKLHKTYRKAGKELKYIITTEWNGKSIHHHLVINDIQGFDKLIREAWPFGGARSELLYKDQDYQALAEYMIKETRETFRDKGNPYRQRYSCSRNLDKPVETVKVIKADSWREIPAVPKAMQQAGYTLDIDTVAVGVDTMGYPYQTYTFIKRE